MRVARALQVMQRPRGKEPTLQQDWMRERRAATPSAFQESFLAFLTDPLAQCQLTQWSQELRREMEMAGPADGLSLGEVGRLQSYPGSPNA